MNAPNESTQPGSSAASEGSSESAPRRAARRVALSVPTIDSSQNREVFGRFAEPMRPREKESDRAYAAFLLYCMQARRSIRRIAVAMSISDGTMRYWRRKHGWERRRVCVADPDWVALAAFRQLMDLHDHEVITTPALRLALDVVLADTGSARLRHAVAAQRQGLPAGPPTHDIVPTDKPGTPRADGPHMTAQRAAGQGADPAPMSEHPERPGTPPAPADAPPPPGRSGPRDPGASDPSAVFRTPLSDSELSTMNPNRYMATLHESTLRNHLRPADIRRQIQLIDGTLGLIAKRVASGKIDVKVSDIPALLKARALITGLPTEQIAVQSTHTHEHRVAVVESTRMRDARERGGPALLDAMRVETDEIQAILRAIPARVVDVGSDDG